MAENPPRPDETPTASEIKQALSSISGISSNSIRRRPASPPPKQQTLLSYIQHFISSDWILNIFFLGGILLILVYIIISSLKGTPLVSLYTPSNAVTQPTLNTTTIPDLIILGAFQGEVFSANNSTDRISKYNFNSQEERLLLEVPKIESFSWHISGKVLFVSKQNNPLGNLYLLDLSDPNPKLTLITNRENIPNFPQFLQINSSILWAWSQDGKLIAFTSQDVNQHQQWLFIYDTEHSPSLIYTPAHNLTSISSIAWISDTLTLVATSDSQEKRYKVNRSGGEFSEWLFR